MQISLVKNPSNCLSSRTRGSRLPLRGACCVPDSANDKPHMSLFRSFIAIVLWLATGLAQAQVVEAVATLVRGKSALDFYEAAVANPLQVLSLSASIQERFSRSNGYGDLNNEFAQKSGLFDKGPMGLEYIELRPEPLGSSPYGAFSITLKRLKFKQCEVLSAHAALNGNFIRVELNGRPVSVHGVQREAIPICEAQWIFQDGKNEIKYVER